MGQPNDGTPAPRDPNAPQTPDPPHQQPQAPPPVGIVTPQANQSQPGHAVLDVQGGGPANPGAAVTLNVGTFSAAGGRVTGGAGGSVGGGPGTVSMGVNNQITGVVYQNPTRQGAIFSTQGVTVSPAGAVPMVSVGGEYDAGGNHPQRPRVQVGANVGVGASVGTVVQGHDGSNLPGGTGVAVNASGVVLYNAGAFHRDANPPVTVGVEARYSGVFATGRDGRPLSDQQALGTVSLNYNRTMADGAVVMRAGVALTGGVDIVNAGGRSDTQGVVQVTGGLGVAFGGETNQNRANRPSYNVEVNGRVAPQTGPRDFNGRITQYDEAADRVTIGEGRAAVTMRISEIRQHSMDRPQDLRENLQEGRNVNLHLDSYGYNRVSQVPERQQGQQQEVRR